MLARNFTAEHNARVAEVPEEERAWTHISRMTSIFPEGAVSLHRWPSVWPGDPGWEEAEAHLRDQEQNLVLAHRAAACTIFGRYWSEDESLPLIGIARDENPPLFTTFQVMIGDIQRVWRLLVAECLSGVHRKDSGAVVRSITAHFKYANLVAGEGLLIYDLVAIAGLNQVIGNCHRILREYPDLLGEEDLVAIQRAADENEKAMPGLHLGELRLMDDLLQRIYTDDGDGDGKFLLSKLKRLETEQDWEGMVPEELEGLMGIKNALSVADRKELIAKRDEIAKAILAYSAMPRWQRTGSNPSIEWRRTLSRSEELRYVLIMQSLSSLA